MELLRFVVVGHVDHGKSTLIGRLLYDTDCLSATKKAELKRLTMDQFRDFEFAFLLDAFEEEQKQNVTIDITHIPFKTKKRDYVIIDAPGHKDFLKNMVSGAASADAAVLMIDAAEGIKEQTRRHAYLLSLLGIKEIIVAINKMDLVGYDEGAFIKLKEEVIALLKKINLSSREIIPLVAREGKNLLGMTREMSWYKGQSLVEAIDGLVVEQREKELRLPIQDVYKQDGKRILVGRIETGNLRKGERLVFVPSLKETVVKTIEQWPQQKDQGKEGESIGITMEEQIFVERGEIACHPQNIPLITEEFRANIFWLGKEPLHLNQKYIIKLTTQEEECEIILIKKRINSSTLEIVQENATEVLMNEVAEVILAPKRPMAVDLFNINKITGRFVLVDHYDVAGGGIVTEALGQSSRTYTS